MLNSERMVRFLKKRQTVSGVISGQIRRRWMSVKTMVMSFGDGAQGALGLSPSSTGLGFDAYEPNPVAGLPPDVSGLAAGHYHSLAVTSEGHVWTWGRNNEAQLGRDPSSERDSWNIPQKVQGLNQVKVEAVCASGVISAAIGKDGSLWVWGKSKRGQLGLGKDATEAIVPARVEALIGEEIVKVSLGWGHALALTAEGKLFGWGYYADGRLGKLGRSLEASPLDFVGGKTKSTNENSKSMIAAAEELVLQAMEKEKDMPIIWEPTLIEEFHVADVACGLDHSLILCNDGSLLSGGSNVYGQLGRANEDLGLHCVDISLQLISVASGLGHSLAVCKHAPPADGLCVVTWGWNQKSQLGREGPENVPLVVSGLEGETPVSVSGGRVHSLVVTDKREVWAWGSGRNGRLGLGSSVDEVEPVLVEYLQDFDVLQAVAGFDHNLVLVAE